MSDSKIAKVTGIRCPKCDRLITSIKELQHVLALGLALYGDCPNCGAQIPIEGLWHVSERVKNGPDNKR